MSTDKDTRIKLLKSAEKEFILKGYSTASLRAICKDCGVTTGALYFFFKDKDDLFEEVARGALADLYRVINEHFSAESEAESFDGRESDIEAAASVVRALFARRELFLMLLTRAQGSGLENLRDTFVAYVEKHYTGFAKQFEKATGKKCRSKKMIHWVAHSQVDVFVFLLEHCETEEEALEQIPGIVLYLTGGWYSMFE